jgi:hypothetical protein
VNLTTGTQGTERERISLMSKALGQRMPSIRIHKNPVMGNYWGRIFKRPLRSDALQEAMKRYFAKPDNALLPSLGTLYQRRYSLGDVRSVTAALFQEGEYAYVFKVNVDAEGGGKSRLAMILAKDGGRISRIAQVEHGNLKRLYGRCKDIVVRPLEGDSLTLPGPRSTKIYAYFSGWLNRHHELGVQHKNMNFYVNELPFQYFDSAASDVIKGRMLTILLRLYDPVRQEAIEPPKVGAGDFVVTRKSPHELRLIACRKILKGLSLDRCIRLYLGYQGSWGDRLFHFLPKDVRLLKKALIEGLVIHNGFSAEDVFFALKRYRDSLARTKPSKGSWTPLPTLNKMLSEAW